MYPPPPAFGGGRPHSLGGEGVGGQYFGRRQTQRCTLHYIYKYSVLHPFSLFNQDVDGTSNVPVHMFAEQFCAAFFFKPNPAEHGTGQTMAAGHGEVREGDRG
jgi:hypothetical protein